MKQRLNYPPFCDIISIKINSKNENEVKKVADNLYKDLNKSQNLNNMMIFKPVPSPINRINNRYRWRIIIKCKFNYKVINLINSSLENFYKSNYKNTSVIVDVNPINML